MYLFAAAFVGAAGKSAWDNLPRLWAFLGRTRFGSVGPSTKSRLNPFATHPQWYSLHDDNESMDSVGGSSSAAGGAIHNPLLRTRVTRVAQEQHDGEHGSSPKTQKLPRRELPEDHYDLLPSDVIVDLGIAAEWALPERRKRELEKFCRLQAPGVSVELVDSRIVHAATEAAERFARSANS